MLEAHWQISRPQGTAVFSAYRTGASTDPEEGVSITGVDKAFFKTLSDSSGGGAGTTTLNANQDEGAMEPLDIQAPGPGQWTVNDGASASPHIYAKLLFYAPMMDIMKVVQINLHHSSAASVLMRRKLLTDNIYVPMIQEPWLSGGKTEVKDAKGAL